VERGKGGLERGFEFLVYQLRSLSLMADYEEERSAMRISLHSATFSFLPCYA